MLGGSTAGVIGCASSRVGPRRGTGRAPSEPQHDAWCIQVQWSTTDASWACTVAITTVNIITPSCPSVSGLPSNLSI